MYDSRNYPLDPTTISPSTSELAFADIKHSPPNILDTKKIRFQMDRESFDLGDSGPVAPKFAVSTFNQTKRCLLFIIVVVLSVCIAAAFIFILIESDVMTVNFPRALPSESNRVGSAGTQTQSLDEVIRLRLESIQEFVDLLKANMTVLNSSSINASEVDFIHLKNSFQHEIDELNHRLSTFHPTSVEVDSLQRDIQAKVLHLQSRVNEVTDRRIKALEDGKKTLEMKLMTANQELIEEKQKHLIKSEEIMHYKSMLLKSASGGNILTPGTVVVIFSTVIYNYVARVWILAG